MLPLKSPNSGSPQKYARTLLHQLFSTEELGTGILYTSAKSRRSPLEDRVKVLFGKHHSLSSHSERLIADIMQSQTQAIKEQYIDVQRQSCPNDCGMLSIAYATHLYM